MFVNHQKLFHDVTNSDDPLIDIKGHFLCFENEDSADMLLAVSLIFIGTTIVIEAQTDDSFKIFSEDEWQPTESFQEISLVNDMPWAKAKGKPLLWSWVLLNQQGYFDGIQLEFAKTVSDDSVIVQLIALGSEILLREVSNRLEPVPQKGTESLVY